MELISMGRTSGEWEKIPSVHMGTGMQTKENGRLQSARYKMFQSSPFDKMEVEHTGKFTGYSAETVDIEIWTKERYLAHKTKKINTCFRFLEGNATG